MRHRLIGIGVLLFAIMLLWSWNSFGREKFSKNSVPVLKEDIYTGDVLSEDIIVYKRIDTDEKVITKNNVKAYIGREAKHYVHKGMPLFSEYFPDKDTDPNILRDRVAVSLSSHHIYNFTGKYKKGDRVILFSKKEIILEAVVSGVSEDEKTIEVISDKAGAGRISEILSEGNKIVIARG